MQGAGSQNANCKQPHNTVVTRVLSMKTEGTLTTAASDSQVKPRLHDQSVTQVSDGRH